MAVLASKTQFFPNFFWQTIQIHATLCVTKRFQLFSTQFHEKLIGTTLPVHCDFCEDDKKMLKGLKDLKTLNRTTVFQMTMAWSSLLVLSLIPALSLASSEAEAGPEAVNIQIGGGTTLDCKEEPDKWIFNEFNSSSETTVLSETGETETDKKSSEVGLKN